MSPLVIRNEETGHEKTFLGGIAHALEFLIEELNPHAWSGWQALAPLPENLPEPSASHLRSLLPVLPAATTELPEAPVLPQPEGNVELPVVVGMDVGSGDSSVVVTVTDGAVVNVVPAADAAPVVEAEPAAVVAAVEVVPVVDAPAPAPAPEVTAEVSNG